MSLKTLTYPPIQSSLTEDGNLELPRKAVIRPNAPVSDNIQGRSMLAAIIMINLAALVTIIASIPPFLSITDPESLNDWSWAIMPIVGSIIASVAILLIHRVKDEGIRVAGRVLFAIMGGIMGPWFLGVSHPAIKDFISHPAPQLGLGFLCGAVGYIVSRYAVERAFARTPRMIDPMYDELERKLAARRKQAETQEDQQNEP